MTPLLTQLPLGGSRQHVARRCGTLGEHRAAGRPARRPMIAALVPAMDADFQLTTDWIRCAADARSSMSWAVL